MRNFPNAFDFKIDVLEKNCIWSIINIFTCIYFYSAIIKIDGWIFFHFWRVVLWANELM